jgi:hypothetical protein
LSVSKEAAQKSGVDRINVKKLTEGEVGEHCQFRICSRSADLETSDNSRDISRVWDNVTERTEISATKGIASLEQKHKRP